MAISDHLLRATRSAALASVLSVAACATAPADPDALAQFKTDNDPAEPTNRKIFGANQFVDRNALQPVARGYQEAVPAGVRHSVHNFVDNLGQPAILVNDGLQGNGGRAWNTTQRFAVNSVVGVLGLFDVATDWGLPAHEADFGQTLGVWGFGPGPVVQLPLFGPSNVRDASGKIIGLVTNPSNFVPAGAVANVLVASSALSLVDGRARLLATTDDLERNSLDYYATLRSINAQRRAALVADGKQGHVASPTISVEMRGPKAKP